MAVSDYGDRIKVLPQVVPNISAARNAGIAAASGKIIAFVDDVAVPEPTWADALLGAFDDPDVMAVTGPVLGRNGISLQWGSMAVNALGQDHVFDPEAPVRDGFARKLHGTNMAFRRDMFTRLGGFDEALQFYLDDTDMAWRIGQAGMRTAWVEGAVVHHGVQASGRRTEERIPLSLFDVGASTAVFLGKHVGDAERADAIRALEAAQSSRLLKLARARKLDADKMRGLMESLRDGLQEGASRTSRVASIAPAQGEIRRFVGDDPPAPMVLSGRAFQKKRLHRDAAEAVAAGQPVSLFIFEPTPRKHRVRFTDGGWWEQSGGLYGPAKRSEKRIQFWSFHARLLAEVRRISATRGL